MKRISLWTAAAAVVGLLGLPMEALAAAWRYPDGSVVAKAYVSRFSGGGHFDAARERVNPDGEVSTYDSVFLEVTAAFPRAWNLYAGIPYKTKYRAFARPGLPVEEGRAFGDLWVFGKRQLTGHPLLISVIPGLKAPTAPVALYGNRAFEAGGTVAAALQAEGAPLQLQLEAGVFTPMTRRSSVGTFGYVQAGAEAWLPVGEHQLTVRAGAETQRELTWRGGMKSGNWHWVKPYAGLKFRWKRLVEVEAGYGWMSSGRNAGQGYDLGFGVTGFVRWPGRARSAPPAEDGAGRDPTSDGRFRRNAAVRGA